MARHISYDRYSSVENRMIARVQRSIDSERGIDRSRSRRRLSLDLAVEARRAEASHEERTCMQAVLASSASGGMEHGGNIAPMEGHLWSRGKGRKSGRWNKNTNDPHCWKRASRRPKQWMRHAHRLDGIT